MAAALAVPLDNGRADVFLSFCIGTGPGDPQLTNPDFPGLDPPLLTTVKLFKKKNEFWQNIFLK